jgi:hypothetical protein
VELQPGVTRVKHATRLKNLNSFIPPGDKRHATNKVQSFRNFKELGRVHLVLVASFMSTFYDIRGNFSSHGKSVQLGDERKSCMSSPMMVVLMTLVTVGQASPTLLTELQYGTRSSSGATRTSSSISLQINPINVQPRLFRLAE